MKKRKDLDKKQKQGAMCFEMWKIWRILMQVSILKATKSRKSMTLTPLSLRLTKNTSPFLMTLLTLRSKFAATLMSIQGSMNFSPEESKT